jgi:hypothetical protein
MSSKVCIAVLGVSKTDYDGINNAADREIQGAYVEVVLFPNMPLTEVIFKAAWQASVEATAAAKDGGKTAITIRNKRSAELYSMMVDKNIPYFNTLYKGDREKLLKSGSNVSDEFVPHSLLQKLIITSIKKGPGDKTVKINIKFGSDEARSKKGTLIFTVYVFDSADSTTGRVGCRSTNSRKLLVSNVPLMTAQYYAVTVQNAAGENELCGKVRFALTE